ncbi:MAG: hypothetical protein ACE362_27845 [Phaeodactylibacter xiamenensis]|nr:hypothetical protein [Phaeodactylibacter xiamenensis]
MTDFDTIGKSLPGSKGGSMFGLRTYNMGRKPFMMLYEGELVCRLFGQDKAAALTLPGTRLFNPRNNRMENWVQIPREQGANWLEWAAKAQATVPG